MNELITTIRDMITEEFSAISMADAMLAIGLSFVLGLFVVLIYKVTYGGVCFSKSFAGCLIMLSMVTSLVILVIKSNIGEIRRAVVVENHTAKSVNICLLLWLQKVTSTLLNWIRVISQSQKLSTH